MGHLEDVQEELEFIRKSGEEARAQGDREWAERMRSRANSRSLSEGLGLPNTINYTGTKAGLTSFDSTFSRLGGSLADRTSINKGSGLLPSPRRNLLSSSQSATTLFGTRNQYNGRFSKANIDEFLNNPSVSLLARPTLSSQLKAETTEEKKMDRRYTAQPTNPSLKTGFGSGGGGRSSVSDLPNGFLFYPEPDDDPSSPDETLKSKQQKNTRRNTTTNGKKSKNNGTSGSTVSTSTRNLNKRSSDLQSSNAHLFSPETASHAWKRSVGANHDIDTAAASSLVDSYLLRNLPNLNSPERTGRASGNLLRLGPSNRSGVNRDGDLFNYFEKSKKKFRDF